MKAYFLNTNLRTILLGVFLLVSSVLVASSKEDTTRTQKTSNPNALGKICFSVHGNVNFPHPSPAYVYITDNATGKEQFIDSIYVLDHAIWSCNEVSEAVIKAKQAVCVLAEVGTKIDWDLRGYCSSDDRTEFTTWELGDETLIDNSTCNFINQSMPCFASTDVKSKKMKSSPPKKKK